MLSVLLNVQYWFMFPTAMVIAIIAMSTITTGAAFFSPIFILLLKLEPRVAIGVALLTQTFGFGAGFYFHSRGGDVDFRLVGRIVAVAIPGIVAGLILINYLPLGLLKTLLGLGIILIGIKLIFACFRKAPCGEPAKPLGPRGILTAFLGGITLGMLSIGLSELVGYHLDKKCAIPPRNVVAITVCLTAIATLIASAGHVLMSVSTASPAGLVQVFDIVKFTIPAVIIGAYLGRRITRTVDGNSLRLFGATMLILMGAIMLLSTIAQHNL